MAWSKYRAVRTTIDNITFASKREAARYQELRILETAGRIIDLETQPAFPLAVNGMKICTYLGDFQYVLPETGEVILEDVKGVKTPVYRIKKKLLRALRGIDITEV